MSDMKTKVSDLLLDFTGRNQPVKMKPSNAPFTALEYQSEPLWCCIDFQDQGDSVRIDVHTTDLGWNDFTACFHKDAARDLFKSLINLDFMPF